MTIEDVVKGMEAAGHFPQVREGGELRCIHVAFGRDEQGDLHAPLVIILLDDRDRWVLTSYQGVYYQVPDEALLCEAAVAILRSMDYCMNFSFDVVQKYNLIELAHTEFETDNE